MNNIQPSDLPKRAQLALVLIYQHMHAPTNVLETPPAHSQLLVLINQALPPRPSPISGKIGPVMTSKEQTARLAEQLRQAGLLVSAPSMQFNMKPTKIGEALAREWQADLTQWARNEQREWATRGRSEAIQKLRRRSERMAV